MAVPAAVKAATPKRGEILSAIGALRAHWRLAARFAARDLQSRYRGSIGGTLWAVLHPLVLLVLYTFVFSIVLRIRLGPDAGTTHFAIFLFCGMLPWLAIQEALSRSASVVVEHGHLIKRATFPAAVLPLFPTISALVHQLIGTGILILALVVSGHPLSLTVPFVLVLLGVQFFFTLGLAWTVAGVAVFFRDVEQFIGLGLTLWVFLTPIFYPPSMMPEGLRFLLRVNPLALLVEAYRAVLLRGTLPPLPALLGLAAVAAISSHFGFLIFRRLERAFADVL